MTLGIHSLCCGHSQNAIWHFGSSNLPFLGTCSEPLIPRTEIILAFKVGAHTGVSQRRLGMRFLEDFPEGEHRACVVKQCSAVQCLWRTAKSSVRPEERRAGQEARKEAAEVSGGQTTKDTGS